MKKIILLVSLILVLSAAYTKISYAEPKSANHYGILNAIEENAQLVVEQFQGQASGKLDFTKESLPHLEFVISDASDFVDALEPEQVDNLVNIFSSYILYVAYKEYGGQFSVVGKDAFPLLMIGEPIFFVGIMAHDKVNGRINGDKADNIPFFYQGLVEHVQSAKQGTKELLK
jgi:hypothetical protein